jgi:hypothetical protein
MYKKTENILLVLHNMLQKCFRYVLFMIQICFKNASYIYLKEGVL